MFSFTLCIGIAYLLLMWYYLLGWLYYDSIDISQPTQITSLTVCIPARNESANIGNCLAQIGQQVLDRHIKKEIIVIDDHSTDNTYELAFAQTFALLQCNWNLKVLRLSDYSALQSGEIAFKKRALAYALSESTGEIFITTDADCVAASPFWLRAMLAQFVLPEVKIITGPVLFKPVTGIFTGFQALDICGMMGITAAGLRQNWQYLANGANLAVRRDVLKAIGGYENMQDLASGDDVFLMQNTIKHYPNGARFAKHKLAVVHTEAQSNVSSFIHQRLRWATKSSSHGTPKTQTALGIAWLLCACIVILFPLALLDITHAKDSLFTLLLFKAISDFPLLMATTAYFQQKRLMFWFFPALILHTLYIVGVGTASMFIRKYTWKGRKVN